jgi:hypothetical protein
VAERPSSVVDIDGWRDLQLVDVRGEDLTQWEIDFVESLTVKLKMGDRLTTNQRTRLQQIREDRL